MAAANAARTRICMASEQDEEEEQVPVEWRRTRYRHTIGFLGHGQSVCVFVRAHPSAEIKGPIHSLSFPPPCALTVLRYFGPLPFCE